MDKRKPNRRAISQMYMARSQWEHEQEKEKRFFCTSCSKAALSESIVTANGFRVNDPSGEVRYLVGYRIDCKDHFIQPFYDSSKVFVCHKGDTENNGSCQTCIYGQAHIVGIDNVPKSKAAAKWGSPPKPGVRVSRIVYRCTNLQRMEQFNEGTFMSAYIKCEHYKAKRGVTGVKDK